ncbi:hypothetical protein [Pedobacter gandavensis]|uniref:Outer membrane protein beta-barrel domain-containing protein n=1 Tax=Pedobacter gandavensis TaxID=2679963 RepID=A0ABR6ESN5_9SPHI|nr:hypothetical protein [Pedobacter gandavensis]MBB2148275.1 hypothetical protein [Pedobacter gandavensis]
MNRKNWMLAMLLSLSITCYKSSVSAQSSIKRGYFNKTKVGFLPGLNDQDQRGFKQRGTEITNVNGYFVSPQFTVGIGLGIVAYVNPTITTIPIFIHAEYDLKNGKSVPYLFGGTGYSFSTANLTTGGLMAESGLGWRIPASNRTSISPELGYRYQRVKYKFIGSSGYAKDNISSLSIGASLRF